MRLAPAAAAASFSGQSLPSNYPASSTAPMGKTKPILTKALHSFFILSPLPLLFYCALTVSLYYYKQTARFPFLQPQHQTLLFPSYSPPCALSSSEPQLASFSDPPDRCRTPRAIAMAGQAPPPPPEGLGDDFLEQIFAMPSSYGTGDEAALAASMALHRSSADGPSAADGGMAFPLGLSLEQGLSVANRLHEGIDPKAERESMQLAGLLPPGFGQLHPHRVQPTPPPQVFHGQVKQGGITATPQPPAPRPKVRARRGQATDPHSIAERQRRERIAERLRALQELVPNTNKTDRAAMLDEILDYVKFLRLQVKVLSMSRLGGAGAVAQLVAEIPVPVEGGTSTCGSRQHIWEKWSNDGTERQVAKLMEEDIGAAMQFLQSKALCMMPISLAMAIYDTQHQSESKTVKPELDAPS